MGRTLVASRSSWHTDDGSSVAALCGAGGLLLAHSSWPPLRELQAANAERAAAAGHDLESLTAQISAAYKSGARE